MTDLIIVVAVVTLVVVVVSLIVAAAVVEAVFDVQWAKEIVDEEELGAADVTVKTGWRCRNRGVVVHVAFAHVVHVRDSFEGRS